ncbi:hypothetical protein GCM10027421_09610 [Microbacterium shaanxiense]
MQCTQAGIYAEVTHAEGVAYLVAAGVFERLGIPARAVSEGFPVGERLAADRRSTPILA